MFNFIYVILHLQYMETDNTKHWYQNNIAKFQSQSDKLRRKYHQLSFWRLVVFFLFLALIGTSIYYQSGKTLAGATLIFGIVFGKLINLHNRVKAKKLHFDLLVEINQSELKRLSLDLHSFPDGAQYIDQNHPYCLDLDLFGSHSLFQWLNRTVTKGGEQLLAKSLMQKSTPDEIRSRQEAAKELASSPEWGQRFLAGGMAFKAHDTDIKPFLDWVNTKTTNPKWYKPALFVLPFLTLILTAAYFGDVLSGYFVLAALAINVLILKRVQPMAQNTYDETHRSINTLKAFEAMIERIEGSGFHGALLQDLRRPFVDKQEMASLTIKQLKDILSRIEVRHNMLYGIFNIYLLLDIIWLLQAESWKRKHGAYISQWFHSLSCYEFLVSLGLTAHSQRTYTFPAVVEEQYIFQTKALGHPLIPNNERVSNHFEIQKKGAVVVLTGSNMSGKSTFLRTVGVNVVMAGMGGSVCASSMQIGDFSLFTSMRTTDSLEQHVSSFYAELERISQLIEQLKQGIPTLFLLDELLKGTNSQDRHLGSSTLIRQLHQGPAFGIISTHDLSLGELSQHHQDIDNFSFNSELRAGKLNFDYKLQHGLCKSFNASELMAKMGIDIEKGHGDH